MTTHKFKPKWLAELHEDEKCLHEMSFTVRFMLQQLENSWQQDCYHWNHGDPLFQTVVRSTAGKSATDEAKDRDKANRTVRQTLDQ